MNYYPAFLNLEGKKSVIVGGGKIAERKALSLIKAGAEVKKKKPNVYGIYPEPSGPAI